MSLKDRAASGVVWTTVSTVITTAVQFLQLAILARLLQPADFGLLAMVMVVIGFASSFADMGVSNAIVHRQDVRQEQLSSLYWLNIFSGIVVFTLVIAIAPLVVHFYQEPRLNSLMLWAALIFLITPIGQQFQMLLQKEMQFAQLAKVEIASGFGGAIVSILAAVQGQGVLSLIWGQLINNLVRAGLLVYLGWKWRPTWRFKLADLHGFIEFGLYQMGERSINYFSWNMDKLLIGRLLGSEALGFYNIAYQLMIRPLSVVNPVITRVAFPVFASIQDDNPQIKRGYLKMIRAIAFINVPIYFGMMVLAPPLVLTWLGSNWISAIPILQVLAGLGIFYALGNPLGSLLLAKGRADIGFWLNVGTLFVYTAAIFIGAHWGVLGVAWALVLSCAGILFPLDLWTRWYLIQMSPLEYCKSFAPFIALSLLMALAIGLLQRGLTGEVYPVQLGILISVGATIYLGSTFLAQRAFLRELVSVVIRRK